MGRHGVGCRENADLHGGDGTPRRRARAGAGHHAGRAHPHALRHARAAAALSAALVVGRIHLVPGLFRAERGFRSREPADFRRDRRRRTRHQRAEDLDFARARRDAHLHAGAHRQAGEEKTARHQPRARRRENAGHHDPADTQHRRARGILRGVFRQRARAARQSGRQAERGLDDREGAVVVRAAHHRQSAPAGLRAAPARIDRARQGARSPTADSRIATARCNSTSRTWVSLFGRFVEQVKRGEPLGEDISMLKIWTTETTGSA